MTQELGKLLEYQLLGLHRNKIDTLELEASSLSGCIGAGGVIAGGTKQPGGKRQGFMRS